MKKILYLVLNHHSDSELSQACQDTWIKDIGESSELVFAGDAPGFNSRDMDSNLILTKNKKNHSLYRE